MRYVLVDRILTLSPREHLRALKNVTATDAAAVSAGAGMPHLAGAMLLESMAQAAGLLLVASLAEPAQPVLAKVQAFAMSALARSGDSVVLDASLDDLRTQGARLHVRAAVEGRPIASAVVFLALIPVDEALRSQMASRLSALFPRWFTPAAPEVMR